MSATVDVRKFKYQLDPLLKRAGWRVDALQLELVKARGVFEICKEELATQERVLLEHMEQIRTAWNERLNVVMHQHALQFVKDAQIRIHEKQTELAERQSELNKKLEACVEAQRKLELLENHQKEALGKFVLEQVNLQSAEVDRDWSARAFWRNEQRRVSK